ncbi:uncharacterized protein LOC130945442 [Arachis stenosperma]|uniref:uncharacterized protein LOC130945442 n=1 Tax=Arachis stenosperma TaxID=217475 RepID=UPI0025ACB888|nr:uncharacterized protein LOC130945442 [Arachis stenosperma]
MDMEVLHSTPTETLGSHSLSFPILSPEEHGTADRDDAVSPEGNLRQAKEAHQSEDRIKGKCIINGAPLTILYDTGASHSFISLSATSRISLCMTKLPYALLVTTPAGKSVETQQVCQRVCILISDRSYLADLVCLPLVGLDIILGMDWLNKNRVLLDCFERKVIFPSQSIQDTRDLPRSSEDTRTRQGYALLNSVKADSHQEFCEIPVVQDFLDIFPEDIPSFPPTREVEFSIELMPGTGSISTAPYWMAPLELAELKNQLEELLQKRIHPTKCLSLGSSSIAREEKGRQHASLRGL